MRGRFETVDDRERERERHDGGGKANVKVSRAILQVRVKIAADARIKNRNVSAANHPLAMIG